MVATSGITRYGTWHLAPCLATFITQANTLWPHRSILADGSIGDPRHVAEGRPTSANGYAGSDHNPDDHNVVCAVDLTHDPAHGVDEWKIANTLAASKDRRVRYLIAQDPHRPGVDLINSLDGRGWRDNNTSRHADHLHVSCEHDPALENDTHAWALVPSVPHPHPQGDPEVQLLVQAKGNTAQWITNGLTRRHVGAGDDHALAVALCNGHATPLLMDDADLAHIPIVGAQNANSKPAYDASL